MCEHEPAFRPFRKALPDRLSRRAGAAGSDHTRPQMPHPLGTSTRPLPGLCRGFQDPLAEASPRPKAPPAGERQRHTYHDVSSQGAGGEGERRADGREPQLRRTSFWSESLRHFWRGDCGALHILRGLEGHERGASRPEQLKLREPWPRVPLAVAFFRRGQDEKGPGAEQDPEEKRSRTRTEIAPPDTSQEPWNGHRPRRRRVPRISAQPPRRESKAISGLSQKLRDRQGPVPPPLHHPSPVLTIFNFSLPSL